MSFLSAHPDERVAPNSHSASYQRAFHAPTPYLNTTISTLRSTVNATHWTAAVLCSAGCSDWYGGSIDPNYNNATFGYGASGGAVATPSSVNSSIHFHDLAIGHFDMDLTKAKNGKATWDELVKGYAA